MDAIARALGVDAVEFRLTHLEDERMRAVLAGGGEEIGWPKPSAAGPRARHRLRHREGQLRRDRGRGLERRHAASRVDRLVVAFECGAIVNPDGLRNQVEGARRAGSRRRAVRGHRVRATAQI